MKEGPRRKPGAIVHHKAPIYDDNMLRLYSSMIENFFNQLFFAYQPDIPVQQLDLTDQINWRQVGELRADAEGAAIAV